MQSSSAFHASYPNPMEANGSKPSAAVEIGWSLEFASQPFQHGRPGGTKSLH